MGESQQVFEPVVVESEYVEHLAFGQANSSFENLLARLVEDVDRRRGRANRGAGVTDVSFETSKIEHRTS